MPRLVYVDEQEDQRNAMEAAVFVSEFFENDELVCLDPCKTLEDTLEAVLAEEPDALITDFVLNEYKAGVEFDGASLIVELQARRKDFPCFLTTGFATDAVAEAPALLDVNAIYSKSESFDEHAQGIPFLMRVKRKIEAHQQRIDQLEEELASLAEQLRSEEPTAELGQRMLTMDDELEALLGHDRAVPSHMKADPLRAITDLVKRSDEFLTQLEKERGVGVAKE